MASSMASVTTLINALRAGVIAVAMLLSATPAAIAAPVQTGHVEAELVADHAGLTPGKTITVALRLKMQRGWHTYWQNPGDSGLATTIEWQLPADVTAGPILWPAPEALPTGPLVNYGYEGETLLLTDIAVASGIAATSPATLTAHANWLVCKETCIPEGADLALTLPVSPDAAIDARWSDTIARARAALPAPLTGWTATAAGKGQTVDLVLTPAAAGTDAANLGKLHFFPYAEGQIEASGPQASTRDGKGQGWTLVLPVASQRVGDFTQVAGVLVASNGIGGRNAVVIDTPLVGTVVAGAANDSAATAPVVAPSAPPLSLGVAMAFALIGGLLLNLMPCVFPVLSLKVLGFASQGGGAAAMRRHGLSFAAGVIVSFWILAALLVALRAAGQQLGWGFQLQSPPVVAGLALLFFVLALNLSGVFEVGQILPSAMANWTAKNPLVNDALSGVLAVVIASPCSAPFMGAALGFALAETVTSTWLVFTALGIGMATPYLLLAFFPAWRTRLPRPGAWMVRLKQLLAFPLYATVVWLAWVLGAQLDNDAVARLGAALLLTALALWAWQNMRSGGARGWGAVALVSVVAAAAASWPVISTSALEASSAQARASSDVGGPWQSYTPSTVVQLTGEGRPVFVDFTAAWCVTCQVNKRLVLNTADVQQAFANDKVSLLRADWTRRDATIGAALSALGRDGVPVYVLFRPGQEPLILPEVLRKQDIVDALASLRSTRS
jgi:thiol:disulfide interchange protein/DsbC/DsbD-like thiol-disulfide interchange protein